MIPEHLKCSDPSRANDVVGCYVTKDKAYDTVHFVTRKDGACIQENISMAGTYDSIVSFFVSQDDGEMRGCQQISKGDYGLTLFLWHVPHYGGDNEDLVLHLLTKHGQVRTNNQRLRQSLASQFSAIRDVGHGLVMVDHEKAKKAKIAETCRRSMAARRARRAAAGQVYHSDVSWAFYRLYTAVDDELRYSGARLRTNLWPHDTPCYMKSFIRLLKVALKLGVANKVKSKYLRNLLPFVRGMRKHESEFYRKFGRTVERECRRRRIRIK